MALDHADLSPRELAVKFTDTESCHGAEAPEGDMSCSEVGGWKGAERRLSDD